MCQFCGKLPATEAHHYDLEYPPAAETTGNHLTALCSPCHEVATTLRRLERYGRSIFHFMAIFRKAIDECFTTSESTAKPRYSSTAPEGSTLAHPLKREAAEITRKKGSNRTAADDARLREIDCELSLWLDSADRPTVPPDALRAAIEQGARKLRQGPQVREGLIVLTTKFEYDEEALGTTAAELAVRAQHTAPVVVQRSRILRTRAKFDVWALAAHIEVDEELVDKEQLLSWLDIAGRRIGLGDWRPARSGIFGRFTTESVEPAT